MNTKEELQKTLTDIDMEIGDAQDEKSELSEQIEKLEGDYQIIEKIAEAWEGDTADLKKAKLDAEVYGESMRIERDGLVRKWKRLKEVLDDISRKAATYRELPIDATDRPESWERLASLLDAVDKARAVSKGK